MGISMMVISSLFIMPPLFHLQARKRRAVCDNHAPCYKRVLIKVNGNGNGMAAVVGCRRLVAAAGFRRWAALADGRPAVAAAAVRTAVVRVA